MSEATQLPVVFLAFANASDNHLDTLKEESRAVFRALQPLALEDKLLVHREESSEFDELYTDLLAYDNRIVIFHYGGHADGTMLQLEGGKGGAGGIAGLLGQQSGLKLVFLNGCATKNQVKLLHAAGVPAVIATAVKISDSKATQFSTAFYMAMAGGQSIFSAFESARNYIEGKHSGDGNSAPKINRHPVYDFAEDEGDTTNGDTPIFEWALYSRIDAKADLEQWRLPDARDGWQLQLEDSRGAIKTPDGDPLLIESRSRVRTLPTLLCETCGTKCSVHTGKKTSCRVCGSGGLKSVETKTTVPDSIVYAAVDQKQARSILKSVVPEEAQEIIQLELIYLPFWLFDVSTRTHVKGERGTVQSFDSDEIEITWSEIEEDIDFHLGSLLVSASGAAVSRSSIASREWNLDNSAVLDQLDLTDNFVPMEQDVAIAFHSAAAAVDTQAKAEAQDCIGGLQQKNITTDTRYTKVAARSVYLPFWYGVAKLPQGEMFVTINGQTGVANKLRIPTIRSIKSKGNSSMNEHGSNNISSSIKTSLLVSIFSGVGIGVMVGLLMGMAAPPGAQAKTVVGIFIGAVGVGLAALLGLNDRHFSTAKGLRIGSFGLAVAISSLSGIYVRDHGLLSPSLGERSREVRQLFPSIAKDDEKVLRLLAAIDSGAAAATTNEAGQKIALGAGIKSRSYQYSGVVQDTNVCNQLLLMSDADATEYKALYIFRYQDEDGKLGWKALADNAEEYLHGDDLLSFLLISRSALCGGSPYNQRVKLAAKACSAGAKKSPDFWLEAFEHNANSQQLLASIQSELSSDAQKIAMQLLGPALCPAEKGATT